MSSMMQMAHPDRIAQVSRAGGDGEDEIRIERIP